MTPMMQKYPLLHSLLLSTPTLLLLSPPFSSLYISVPSLHLPSSLTDQKNMWGVFDKAVEFVRSSGDKKYLVYRDELSKEPLILREEEMEERRRKKKKKNGEGRGVAIRVKILMTREEAERLLSKCKDGGSLEFKDVVQEMVKIPANRVSVVDPETYRHDGVLKSIPEEC